MTFHRVAAVLFALVFWPSIAFPCSCIADVPLCQSFWQADAVFAGEILSFEKSEPGNFLSSRVARVRVDRSWRGEIAGTIEVTTGAGGGDCGYGFQKGSHYVIYAYRRLDGGWTTNICTPTKLLSRASADLLYFKESSTAAGRIYGAVYFDTRSGTPPGAAGLRVALRNASQSWAVTSGEKGTFEFTGIPSGKYAVEVEGAGGAPGSRHEIRLPDPRACLLVNLYVPRPAKRP